MRKILIIEDDTYIRDLYMRSFQRDGYEVEAAVDGEEALNKVKTGTYDVILLDIMLPKVTGIDVLKSIRSPDAKAKDTPVFLTTNLGQEDIIKEAFKIGADGYLLKAQLTPQDVVDEINSFFKQQSDMSSATSQTSE
ncbi:response regulator [Candidatus Gottesmanbacteria bacterium]|nr:response regulator [Candidatus Gottesmanbacteria bacterium]